MNVFGKYSRYYNLLYKDKDYAGEAEYVHSLIQKYNPNTRSILNLGCGTGRHDVLLAEKGYSVTGVDMSEEMLAVANSQLSSCISQPSTSSVTPQGSVLSFLQGDIRTIRLNRTFDVIISLFHVISYQTTNEDLVAAFTTAKAHLKPGGKFIFDCWYGPAVLTDRPVVRVKRLEDEEIEVTRIAEPVMQPNENVVEVNYQVMIVEKATNRIEEVRETHRMRYLFMPEIIGFLSACGFKMIHATEWMTQRSPGADTWGVCCTATVSE
jgi:SAM-dependent methyltransferase